MKEKFYEQVDKLLSLGGFTNTSEKNWEHVSTQATRSIIINGRQQSNQVEIKSELIWLYDVCTLIGEDWVETDAEYRIIISHNNEKVSDFTIICPYDDVNFLIKHI